MIAPGAPAPRRSGTDWWRNAVVYEIYPRSFADGNGDGVGDLEGIISRVAYLDALGIDAVWLTPFYPSALVDGGYDVDDYRDVDPILGDLIKFNQLSSRLHERNIGLIIDIVPNHCSDRHRWFQEALDAGRGSPERERFHFRDGQGNGPPSDWPSFFGGSAWTQVEDGQWYLHLFTAAQPDWNWDHPEVRADFLKTLQFWGDRGVDGFRVDTAFLLCKDLPEILPSWEQLISGSGSAGGGGYPAGQHPLWDRDQLDDIYSDWRDVFDSYDPPLFAVAEAWVPVERRIRYAQPGSLGQAFNFDLLQAKWDAEAFRSVILESIDFAQRSNSSSTWVLSNHDVVRHATRYGLPPDASEVFGGSNALGIVDQVIGVRRARAAILLVLALPGSTYLYQGEELGLREVVDLPDEVRQDPTFFRSDGSNLGRDGARVPLPWEPVGTSFGFSSRSAHLPQPTWFGPLSVASEEHDPSSTLTLYRKAIDIRRQLLATRDPITGDDMEWLDLGPEVVGFRRGRLTSITNFSDQAVRIPPGSVLVTSEDLQGSLLASDTTVWLESAASSGGTTITSPEVVSLTGST
jgi:alpha-glucosidase